MCILFAFCAPIKVLLYGQIKVLRKIYGLTCFSTEKNPSDHPVIFRILGKCLVKDRTVQMSF